MDDSKLMFKLESKTWDTLMSGLDAYYVQLEKYDELEKSKGVERLMTELNRLGDSTMSGKIEGYYFEANHKNHRIRVEIKIV